MVWQETKKQARRLTDLHTWLLALLVGLLGVFLLWLAEYALTGVLYAVVSQIGGLVVATGLLTVAWDKWGRRTFATEVMAMARVGTDVDRAGIRNVTDQYILDVEWERLLQGTSKLDIVVAYAATWRNTHRASLEAIARRPGTRIRVYLPDPDDADTMKVLALRFSRSVEDLQSEVREAVQDYSSLAAAGGGAVEVYVRAGDAVFSCYRMDGRAVLTLYSHGRERRSSVPTFVLEGGDLWSFVYKEIQAIRAQSTRLFPPDNDGRA